MKAITLMKKASLLALVVFGIGLGGCASIAPPDYGKNYGDSDRVVHIERDPVTGNVVSEVEATGDGIRSVRIRNNRNTRSTNTSNSNGSAAADGEAAGKAKACAKEEYKDTPACTGQ